MARVALWFGLLLALACPVQAAPDLAELLPAETIAYAEAVQLKDLAPIWTQYTHGSALADIVAFLDKHRAKASNDENGTTNVELGAWGALIGPEMLGELPLMNGAATALVGYDKDHVPETVSIVHTGTSRLANYLMRHFLATQSMLRVVETIDGVKLYQEAVAHFPELDANGLQIQPKKPTEYAGSVYAQVPGSIVVGSSRAVVAAVVRRLKGQAGGASLAKTPRMLAVQALRRMPGLFVYADIARGLAAQKPADGAEETFPQALMRELLHPQAFRTLIAHVAFAPEQLALTVQLERIPKQTSPLLELVHPPTGPTAAVPTEGAGGVQVGVPPGGKLWAQLLAVADAVGRAQGVIGKLPSDAAHEAGPANTQLEAACAKVVSLTVLLPDWTTTKKGWPLPTLVCTCADAPAAAALVAALPGLGPIAGAGKVSPIVETIQGQKVHGLAGTAFPWQTNLHYGVAGPRCVIGTNAAQVARLLNEAPAAAPADNPAVGVWRWGHVLADGLAQITPKPNPAAAEGGIPRGGFIPNVTVKYDDVKPVLAEVRKRTQDFPPLRVQIRPGADRWELFAQQPLPAKDRAGVIDSVLDWVVIAARLQYAIAVNER